MEFQITYELCGVKRTFDAEADSPEHAVRELKIYLKKYFHVVDSAEYRITEIKKKEFGLNDLLNIFK